VKTAAPILVPSEAQLQAVILDWLAAVGILAFRMNVGAIVKEDASGKKRTIRFGVLGMADILAFPRGRICWIEIKAPDGRQSQWQRSFQAQVERHGHRYVLARSLEEVQDALAAEP
jgi:hypothetical protein